MMNSDEILAELDAQYQELIQSVQLEGLSQDDNSEQSSKQIEEFHKGSVQNVTQIIKKYEQTLQTSREFYESEIKKLGDTKRKTESKYIESKKQIKHFENKIAKISKNHQSQITTLTEQKETQIKHLNEKLKNVTDKFNEITTKHAKCSGIMQINQQCLEKLQQENGELQGENVELKGKYGNIKTELEELQMKYNTQSEVLCKKKTSIEKYKLEIIQTRTSFDEQQKEFVDLQKQLKECRDEINFLCTTNEDLYNINENLSKKLEKYPQTNSLLNSVILDNKSEEKDENKCNNKSVENNENMSIDFSQSVSVFNLQNNNIQRIETFECPELKTSNMFMMENDNKIKEELYRISYDEICKEKNDLIEKIKEYEKQINYLETQLITQESISNEIKEGQITEMESVINIQNELDKILKENKELKIEKNKYDARIKEIIELNEKSKNEILRLNDELNKIQLNINNNNNEKEIENIIKEKCKIIDELNMELDILKEENIKIRHSSNDIIELKKINGRLESEINASQLSTKRLNDRFNKLTDEYQCLQSEFHEIKLKYNETISKEEEYKQQIHKLNVNIKFMIKESEQYKTGQLNLRENNTKQSEEISELNHDIKQIFRDLENNRMQLMQSQQLITTLEKQLFNQTQKLEQTRQQLQMQMQINMQNLNVMNNLKNSMENNHQNINTINQNKYNATTYTQQIKNRQNINGMQIDTPITIETKISPQKQTFPKMSRPQTPIIPNNIVNIARGKPFLNRQSSLRGNNRNAKNEQLSLLLKERRKFETQLFKLPTLPRSLEQRKKKHSLEYKIREIETQIESIKKSK